MQESAICYRKIRRKFGESKREVAQVQPVGFGCSDGDVASTNPHRLKPAPLQPSSLLIAPNAIQSIPKF
jgi:hypothetical protein